MRRLWYDKKNAINIQCVHTRRDITAMAMNRLTPQV
jgi:hypothetical protein